MHVFVRACNCTCSVLRVPRAAPGAPPRKMATLLLFGDQKQVETAERMIWEAVDNRAQKQKQRAKEYERKREEKRRNRQLYHLRHTKVGHTAWSWRGPSHGVQLAGLLCCPSASQMNS